MIICLAGFVSRLCNGFHPGNRQKWNFQKIALSPRVANDHEKKWFLEYFLPNHPKNPDCIMQGLCTFY